MPVRELLNTYRFNEEWAGEHRHWLVVKRGEEVPETEEYGFGSFVFEARRPFHPVRLRQMVEGDSFDGVVRSKGVVWLATRHDHAGEWSQAGHIFALHPAGMWLAASPPDQRPDDPEFQREIDEVWQQPWGDRRIELVIIGRYLDEGQIIAALNECLLSDEELEAGPAAWYAWDDPFDLCNEFCDLPEEHR